jgi:Carboxylesterase family
MPVIPATLITLLLAQLSLAEVVSLDYATFKGKKTHVSKGVKGKLHKLINGGLKETVTYYGIPYAAPPVNQLRFKAPQPPLNMKGKGEIDSTKPAPSCMIDVKGFLNYGAKPSEDCLNMNVYAPASANANSNLPVLVYVYPGAFKDDYPTFMVYDDGARVEILTWACKILRPPSNGYDNTSRTLEAVRCKSLRLVCLPVGYRSHHYCLPKTEAWIFLIAHLARFTGRIFPYGNSI